MTDGLEARGGVLRDVEVGGEQARAIDFLATGFGEREGDFGDRGTDMAGEIGSAPGLDHARAGDQSLDLVGREHDGREIEARAEAVADAGLALDGDAGDGEIADVPIDGALGDLQPAGELRGGGQTPPAQVLDDLEEPISAPYGDRVARGEGELC